MKALFGWILVMLTLSQGLLAEVKARLEINPQGQPLFTILQDSSPLQSEPRLRLIWPNSPIQNLTGPLVSTWWNEEQLLLIVPKTIFIAPRDQQLQLFQKAPRDFVFLSMGAASDNLIGNNLLLRNLKDGRFFRQLPDGTQHPIIALETYKNLVNVIPWASPKHPLLWIPQQQDLDKDILCVFSPDFENCRFINPEMNGLPAGISETARGVWFLPQKGITAKLWDGHHLKSEQLPVVEGSPTWLALAESQPQHIQGIHGQDKNLAYWDGKASYNLNAQTQVQVQVQTEDRPLWQQALLFAVMVSSFVVVLHWRQEAMLQRRVTKQASQMAPIWRRCLAFALDYFILQTPAYLLSKALHFPQPPIIDIEEFALLTTAQQIDFAYSMIDVVAYTLLIMLIIAYIYHALMEYFMGGSLGKLFFSIRVESTLESKLNAKQVLVRNLVKILDYLFFPLPPSLFFAAFSKENRSLADRASSTRVIQLL